MAIENRNLEPGTKLVAHYKKETYHALVVAGPEGKVLYQLSPYDGREFKSPSSLGTAVTGKACNGWTFWSIASGLEEPPPAAEGEIQAEETVAGDSPDQGESDHTEPLPEVATSMAGFRRVPNQRGVPEGEVRLYCDACQGSFTTPSGQQPDTSPRGTGQTMLPARRKPRASCPTTPFPSNQAGSPVGPAFLSICCIHQPLCQ
jgi:hypothetical protein